MSVMEGSGLKRAAKTRVIAVRASVAAERMSLPELRRPCPGAR